MITEQHFKELDLIGARHLSYQALDEYVEYLKNRDNTEVETLTERIVNLEQEIVDHIADYKELTDQIDSVILDIGARLIPNETKKAIIDMLQY